MESPFTPLGGKASRLQGFSGKFYLKPVWNLAKKPIETLTPHP